MSQIRHENDPKNLESMLHRIYKTFIANGAPLELNVTTQDQVRHEIQSLQWVILSRTEAVMILKETETQVLEMLKSKLTEFTQTKDLPIDAISNPQKMQKRVVIIGGGFTGFTVASILDPMPLFHVTLIDTKDSFEYTPGIVKKLVNPEQSSSLRVRHDAYVRNGKVIIGYVDDIGDDATSVTINDEKISFDYLVVATGSSYSSQLKSTDVSSLYRLSGLEQVHEELVKSRRVLIIGGGLVGCELASEITQHTFPGPYPHKHVTLIESHPNVVSRSDDRQQGKAQNYLVDLGVEVVCNERIIDFDTAENNSYLGSSGRVYSGYDKVFMATGTRPNSDLFMTCTNEVPLESSLDHWGRIRVKQTLQVDHFKYQHIFAGGDVTNVVEEKTGYAATISGVCIARNICRMVKGKPPLKQGSKGTLPAPDKPLHGMMSHGGIGKQKLGLLKKKFSFLNPAWAALKYFDEQQFLRIVQGQAIGSTHVLGRLPRRLMLPNNHFPNSPLSSSFRGHSFDSIKFYSRPVSLSTPTSPRSQPPCQHSTAPSAMCEQCSDSSSSLEEFLVEHFTFGGEKLELFDHERVTSPIPSESERRITRRRSSVASAGSSCSATSAGVRRPSLSTPIHV
ncbi:hypothetical protein DFQ29_005308 [Apophysomyces sp. BC1021]|nr:hypothetical protein DFQ29_005308 [Apophysomyces sp. BC1021]